MTDDNRKHFEFIQNIITRMNTNSFMIKGWTITIVSAIYAVYASTKDPEFLLIAVIPLIVFWLLDTFYLRQERLFRCLYNEAIKENSIIGKYEIRIPERCLINKKNSFCNVFTSRTIWPLYFILIILTIGIYIYVIFSSNNEVSQSEKVYKIELKDTLNIKGTINNEVDEISIHVVDTVISKTIKEK